MWPDPFRPRSAADHQATGIHGNRCWNRGAILADGIGNGTLFALRLTLTGPTAREITNDFAAAQDWIAGSRHGLRVLACACH